MRVTWTVEKFFEVLVRGPQRGLIERLVVWEFPWRSTSNIDVCVVGISGEDDERDAFHDLAGVSLHLSSDRKGEAGGTVSDMIFGWEKLVW